MRFIIGDLHNGRFFGINTNSRSLLYPFVIGCPTWVTVSVGVLLVMLGVLCLWYGFACIKLGGI